MRDIRQEAAPEGTRERFPSDRTVRRFEGVMTAAVVAGALLLLHLDGRDSLAKCAAELPDVATTFTAKDFPPECTNVADQFRQVSEKGPMHDTFHMPASSDLLGNS